jgi:MFS family permease
MVSVVGDKIHQIALGILVYDLTGSMLQMGVMLAITTLPAALFGLFAGVFVDRWDRRTTMIAADVGRALLVVAIPFAAAGGVVAVYIFAFAVAGVSLFFEPAKLSLIPELVDAEELMAANSLDNATVSVAELAGLAFAAALVAGLGSSLAFYIDGGTYLASAVCIMFVRHRAVRVQPGQARAPRVFAEAAEGVAHIRGHTVLRDVIGVHAVAALGVAGAITVVYLLALERYSAGAAGLATLDAAITVGLLLGSVLVSRVDPTKAGRTLLVGLGCFGVLFAATAFAPGIAVAAGLLFLAGIANMWFHIPLATLLQRESSSALRGRVMAAKQTLTRLATVIGFVGSGALAERVGLEPTILLIGVVVIVAALAGWSRPALRSA